MSFTSLLKKYTLFLNVYDITPIYCMFIRVYLKFKQFIVYYTDINP